MQAMRLLVWQSVCTWLFACSLALPAGVIPLIGLLLGCLTCLSYGQFSLPLAVSSSAVAPTSTAAAMPGDSATKVLPLLPFGVSSLPLETAIAGYKKANYHFIVLAV
eukprot:GHRR01035160.1.p2 GENE.GHRR01035160.1~~GHRR01035160.1.p2  ORF type:complete len:107 (+),score=8.01 GHRR01035160.1:463-783(+)